MRSVGEIVSIDAMVKENDPEQILSGSGKAESTRNLTYRDLGIHGSQSSLKFPGLSIVFVALRYELHAVTITVAVADKTPEHRRMVGIRRCEFDSDLRTHGQVDVGPYR